MNYIKIFKNHFCKEPLDSQWQLFKALRCQARLKSKQQVVSKSSSLKSKKLEDLIVPLALEEIKNKIIQDSANEIMGIINLLIEKVFLQKSKKKNHFIENQIKEIIKKQNKIFRLEISEKESKNICPAIKASLDLQINNQLRKSAAVLFVADQRIEIDLQDQIKHLQILISESENFSLALKNLIKTLL